MYAYGHYIFYVLTADLIVLLKLSATVNITGFATLTFIRTSVDLSLFHLTTQVITRSWVISFSLALNTVQTVALMILTCSAIEQVAN